MLLFLYTPLCTSDIFPEEPNAKMLARDYISYEGKTLYVEKTEDGNYQLLQLLSTDPQDFLNEQFFPGNILS